MSAAQEVRDYVGEVRALIDAETANAYVSREVAAKIVQKLRIEDPELLAVWLDAQAETMIWRAINDRDRSARSHVRAVAGRSVFADVLDQANLAKSETVIRDWLATPWVVATGERKPLAIMTKADCYFVADEYAATGRRAKLHEAFHRAIGRKIGADKVSDHFTNDQLSATWQALTQ